MCQSEDNTHESDLSFYFKFWQQNSDTQQFLLTQPSFWLSSTVFK